MRELERRVERLEQVIQPEPPPLFVWLDTNETQADALRRSFPDGPPAGRPVTFVTWLPAA